MSSNVPLLSDDYLRLPPASITTARDERQRTALSTEGLRESIALRGIINPLVVTREHVLVAGERRLAAAIELGLPTVPVRYVDTLDQTELQILELEENLRRSDLTWQDSALAVRRIHDLYAAKAPGWQQQQTAEALGLGDSAISMYLRVARELNEGRLQHATGIRAALNFVQRSDERKSIEAVEQLIHAGAAAGAPKAEPASAPTAPSVLCADFLSWAPAYTGRKFNFIHCDFPYGIKVFAGKQTSRGLDAPAYSDEQDIYDALITTLCTNLDRLMTPSGHLMFWCSMKRYFHTLVAFRKQAPGLVFNAYPLIWVKSDNVGVAPDPRGGPRHVYEVALMASREERPVVKVTANAYVAPTEKSLHPHTKPEPVLRHFFQLFVDQSTRMLDPTAGSGTALRAAESLGASQVFGLELNEGFCADANEALRKFRVLRRA